MSDLTQNEKSTQRMPNIGLWKNRARRRASDNRGNYER